MRANFRRFLSSITAGALLLAANGHHTSALAQPGLASNPITNPPLTLEATTAEADTTNVDSIASTDATPATPAIPISALTDGFPDAKVVLTRSASWFVFPEGCAAVQREYDLIVHFHGAHSTMIPRYLASGLDAVLVIVNKGNIGSGPYSKALAIQSQVDDLLTRIENTVGEECEATPRAPRRLALSSWSAGYGATQQVLRFRADRVDAVLLSDGLHVGFTDERRRRVRLEQMPEFSRFATRAARGEGLMAITHSAIRPPEYAGAGETAMALAGVAHAPCWPLLEEKHGMTQLTAARRGQFFIDGFAGNDKAAHASHLYSIHKTVFARLREYWSR